MTRLVTLDAAQRLALVEAARRHVDVKFQHRGRSVRGMDCLGLVVLAMRDIGVEMVDREVYGRDPSADGIREAAVAHFGDPIPLGTLQPGDVVLLQWHQQPNHVAIVGDYPYGGLSLIHCLAQEGRVVEHRLADPWPRRLLEGYRP